MSIVIVILPFNLESESDIDSSSDDGMDDATGRGNGVKVGTGDRSEQKRPRKKAGHTNRDRGALRPNLAKAVSTPKVPTLPAVPQAPPRTDHLPTAESEKGTYFLIL